MRDVKFRNACDPALHALLLLDPSSSSLFV